VILVRQPAGHEFRRGDAVGVRLPAASCSLLAADGTLIGPAAREIRE
jgi:hypothetical protein